MKLQSITFGGRKSLPNYEHLNAEVSVQLDESEATPDALNAASFALEAAFEAAQSVIRNHGKSQPVAPPAPRATPPPAAAKKAAPAAPATPPPAPATLTPKAADKAMADGAIQKRVAVVREILGEREIAEGEFLIAARAKSLVDVPGLSGPVSRKQIEVIVDTIAKVMDASDDVPV